MLFVTNLTWTALLLKTVKHMLYLGYILLHYIFQFSLKIFTSECD